MDLKTILNAVEPYPGFVYGKQELVESRGKQEVHAHLRPRVGRQPTCSGCRGKGPVYDELSERRFLFVPLWGIAVVFLYTMRRVDCERCGVKVEAVPWADGKKHLTRTFE